MIKVLALENLLTLYISYVREVHKIQPYHITSVPLRVLYTKLGVSSPVLDNLLELAYPCQPQTPKGLWWQVWVCITNEGWANKGPYDAVLIFPLNVYRQNFLSPKYRIVSISRYFEKYRQYRYRN